MDAGGEWARVRMAEGLRPRLPVDYVRMADRDVAAVHDEVVKRLRRKQYKDGWKIQFKIRVMPEIWTVLQPEFVAAGASVAHEGDKVVVEFFSTVCLSRVFFKERLVNSGSKYVVKHGVLLKLLSSPAKYPCSAVGVSDVRPFRLIFATSKCELTVHCHWEHFYVYGNLVI